MLEVEEHETMVVGNAADCPALCLPLHYQRQLLVIRTQIPDIWRTKSLLPLWLLQAPLRTLVQLAAVGWGVGGCIAALG